MPWTPKDSLKHKKGLTPAQQKTWAKIANSALQSCLNKGGADCEGSAIRIANSQVGGKKEMAEDEARERIEALIKKLKAEEGPGLEDWEYLVHHIHQDPKSGKEELHHCPMLDHLGNLYVVEHMKDNKGKFRHCLIGLGEDQEIYWSDEEAMADGQEIPCANRQLK